MEILEVLRGAMGSRLVADQWGYDVPLLGSEYQGTPNSAQRALATIRYVRRWYSEDSREVNAIPNVIWQSLPEQQRAALRFPVVPERASSSSLSR